MALTYRLSEYARDKTQVGGLNAQYNNGYRRVYSGARPATPDTALGGGNTLLAELRFNAVAFAAPVAGVATANAFTNEDSILASGTATFFRDFASDGTTVLGDGECGVSGANMNIDNGAATTDLTAGRALVVTGATTLTTPMQEC